MSLATGNYLMRLVPTGVAWPFAGGEYATRPATVNIPIPVQRQTSSNAQAQVWSLIAGSTAGTYKITQPVIPHIIGIGPVISGISVNSTNNHVYYGRDILDWVLTPVDTANNIYVVAESTHEIGSINTCAVKNGNLAIETVALGDNKDPLPQWQFVQAPDLD